jgi:diacylglycerol kinase (ATP)
MLIVVLHHPGAGGGGEGACRLMKVLGKAGHRVRYRSLADEDCGPLPGEVPDVVVACGGDGTVAEVAMAWAGSGVPLAIFPAGTANNVARTLGVPDDPEGLLARLERGARRPLDLGVVGGPAREGKFVEAVGTGLFAEMLERRERDQRKGREDAVDWLGSIEGGRKLMRDLLDETEGREVAVSADGEKLSGCFLLVEVMNIQSLGPLLRLAPAADPGDGLLDLVLVRAERRGLLARYLEGGCDETEAGLFERRQAAEVVLEFPGTCMHRDDEIEVLPGGNSRIEIKVQPGVVEVLGG